ncbi:DMT family transporter [Aurantimonas endophytica]|uniref:Drug/metabolite transporter (DMT)-like permease n=1 Tax=Aurantimonas endophytica TaxID=1522175 RepID=A0A7W6HA77_9HYPH|nr:DMT family transporter [Aurantimonas endophytica]MBB4001198.1 drug/metabolite transporter (DMT)-like permease [Aurantimonas endophytica]MCO6403150.1 EamA family transporter [Aurantimonas endophytica]
MAATTIRSTAAGEQAASALGLAYAAFVALGLIWGSNFIFVKWAAEWISPSQIVLLRVLFGFLPLLVTSVATRALQWRDWRHAHHFVVMSVLATTFYYVAFAKGTVLLLSSVAGMLSGAIPLFTFVTALAFLRSEPINARSVVGTLLGFLGILLIARPWNQDLGGVDPVGILWMIAGSFSVGASFVYAKRFISPLGLTPLALTTYQIGIALVLLVATTDLDGIGAVIGDTRASLGLVLGLGLCGTGLAYILYYRIVDRLGAVAASGVTYIPPVVSLAIGAMLVGEPVKPLDIVAMGAILVGVAVLQSGRARQLANKPVSSSEA